MHYTEYHKNNTNAQIHAFCIPILVFSSLVYMKSLKVYGVFRLSDIYEIFCFFYYFSYNFRVGTFMLFYLIILDSLSEEFIIRFSNTNNLYKINTTLFITAWILQFWGHYIEGSVPALTDSLSTAITEAPMFSLNYIVDIGL